MASLVIEHEDLGMDLVFHAKYLLKIISQIYDKVAALKIHEITTKNVVLQVRSASNILHLLYHKVNYLEHFSSSAFHLVSCCQTYLLFKGINETDRLTKVYRAVRILRNEKSRFGRDLSLEDRKWADRYLEQCRHRGLHLAKRRYAVELLRRIEERSAIYRMFLSEELSLKVTDINTPVIYELHISDEIDDFVYAVGIRTDYILTFIEIQQTLNLSNEKYADCVKQLKNILHMRDMLSKLFGFINYMQLSVQSLSLSRIQIKKLLKRILYIHEASWLQVLDESKAIKAKANVDAGIFCADDFNFKDIDAHYYYKATPAIDFIPLFLYYPVKATMSKILGLLGDYFGITFSAPKSFPDAPEIVTSTIVDTNTGRTLGRVVLDIFTRKYKRYRKKTLAFHNASKEFFDEFLPSLDDKLKKDPRFERFENLNDLPVTCFVFLNLSKRVYVVDPSKESDKTEDSIRKENARKKFNLQESYAFHLTPSVNKHANSTEKPSECKKLPEVNTVSNDDNICFTVSELAEIFYEFGNVLQHIFCEASSPELRTCCSNKDFLRVPCAMLQHLLLEPVILRSISTHRFRGTQLSIPDAYSLLRFYKWEEPLKVLHLVQHSHLDYSAHTQIDFDPLATVRGFSSDYLTIKEISDFHCPDWFFSLSDQNAGAFYADAWAYHVSKVIFDVTFKARSLNPEVGKEFRRHFLEPDIDVSFYVRLRNFLGENPETKSSLEINSSWFSEFKE